MCVRSAGWTTDNIPSGGGGGGDDDKTWRARTTTTTLHRVNNQGLAIVLYSLGRATA